MSRRVVLCYSKLLDETRESLTVFRHPLFAYSEETRWPPEEWIAREGLHCWHCCQLLTVESAVPMPHAQDASSGRFTVYGLFCSWSCAKRYIMEAHPWSCGEKLLLLEDMAREAFGFEGTIEAAPPRQRLKMFGGDLSPRSFREEARHPSVTLRPPMLLHPEIYERYSEELGGDDDTRPPWARNFRNRAVEQQNESLYEAYCRDNAQSAPPAVEERQATRSLSEPPAREKASSSKGGTLSVFMRGSKRARGSAS
jgi:hypothetical protein